MRRRRPARRLATGGAAFFTPLFALPLFLDPYRWARAFGWPAEPETAVGAYFGRCLGAMALAGSVQAARAARDPRRYRSHFEFIETSGWLLAAVHLRGLLERRQPPIEHAEIAMWSGVALAGRHVRLRAGL